MLNDRARGQRGDGRPVRLALTFSGPLAARQIATLGAALAAA
jgi:hypothetical protein